MIWDFDDDNGLKRDIREPHLPSLDVFHLVFNQSCSAFNPYPVMGGPTDPTDAWPRGFPLDLIKQPCRHEAVPCNLSRVAVLQSLADHEPDVDGIYRLTRVIPFAFNPNSTRTLVIPHGTLVPYNAQATLVLQPAFFTQLLPITVGLGRTAPDCKCAKCGQQPLQPAIRLRQNHHSSSQAASIVACHCFYAGSWPGQ